LIQDEVPNRAVSVRKMEGESHWDVNVRKVVFGDTGGKHQFFE
jgi:hypothetical protein